MLFRNLCVFLLYSIGSCTDYYELLGISKDADDREIRKAFKKLALKLHPDKTQGKDTHDQFITINKAYEVLKDESTRKKYDLYGEEGLKDDFGSSWKGNYRSWNYYSESFGIYDDDPEIVTLNRHNFAQSVLESSELWFVNFFSPQCSHCHHLASTWRELSLKLLDVIHIGAVNCEEDWILCRQQNVHSYPSLILYPRGEKYQGLRDIDSMMDFVLENLPDYSIKLTSDNFISTVSRNHFPDSWLIFCCDNPESSDCFSNSANDLKMLSAILKNLVNVANVPCSDTKLCEKIHCSSRAAFYSHFHSDGSCDGFQDLSAIDLEIQSIAKTVLKMLPDPEELSEEKLKTVLDFKNKESKPMLVQFTKAHIKSSVVDIELKRLKALLPEVWLVYFDCAKYQIICSSLFIKKYPTFILFKGESLYEFFYGRISVHDVVQFTKAVLLSQVHTLTPANFPGVTQSQDIWFIDFFAPWCPPCMELLPHWRKASQSIHHSVKFGTVDCSTHVNLCRMYNINSYPTTILYNNSIPHGYSGLHSHSHILEFIEDILHPSIVSLSPQLFNDLVRSKRMNEIWVIDFYAPWCGPCQQLAPQWQKLAKMLKSLSFVHIGDVNCQLHSSLCDEMNINSYPTILLYPRESTGIKKFVTFNGRSRDAASLQGWIHDFLPSKVESLGSSTYKNVLSDTQPWVIDFFAPWCGHCQMFAPEFEKVAQVVEGQVKVGKVNCDHFPDVCKMAGVQAYPTILFYEGRKGHATQNPMGEEIEILSYKGVFSFLNTRLELKNNKEHIPKDEL
ncbi:dnaJ homolog subfamily C member 10 isoform X1 [Parasteatoda tepidariorum]|uniref:dnaJ homolog subfamily C member 10 isoform X1 n=1 Tax=Parasteatoda tepidariorum TaxID=114398 RepID=UPI00077FD30B|nr:dnaJ homolog subfamily C member 10 [Parasteatoda tepidariorum]